MRRLGAVSDLQRAGDFGWIEASIVLSTWQDDTAQYTLPAGDHEVSSVRRER